jgi:hypothetical protein
MNRSIHKNLATLRELKAERKRNYERDRDEEITIARSNDMRDLPYKAPAWLSRNGSVFANDEILVAANRESVVAVSMAAVGERSFHVQFAGACDVIDPNRPNSGLRRAAAA